MKSQSWILSTINIQTVNVHFVSRKNTIYTNTTRKFDQKYCRTTLNYLYVKFIYIIYIIIYYYLLFIYVFLYKLILCKKQKMWEV